MSTPTSTELPQRSGTVSSGITRRTSLSDDDAIPDGDSSETTKLLVERLRAWKHMVGNLEDFVAVTAKVSKGQAKDYEKIMKSVSDPLKEGHHFSSSAGGVAALFENLRHNTQGMVNMYNDSEKNLKGSVLPTLERLHKEIKNKAKELTSGGVKGAKAVEKARHLTQKHIELLGQNTAAYDAAASNRIEGHHDPYVLKRGINHRLNKQVSEENNQRNDILAVQNAFQQFEAHTLQTIQTAMDQFFQIVGGQLDRQRAMYADILGTAQRIPADFEWVNFVMRNDQVLVNPDSAPRTLESITFPNMDHKSTHALIEGSLERRSRAVIKGYSTGYYVVTPAHYLHEFKDDDDFRRDPSPELSLYLPDCVVGSIDGVKFAVKGKDVSSGKVGNAFHTTTELHFKAHTPADAEKWWNVIKDSIGGPSNHTSSPVSPIASATPSRTPSTNLPPSYAEKEQTTEQPAVAEEPATSEPATTGAGTTPATTETKDQAATDPTQGLDRSASTASHFHTAPAGSAVDEKTEKS